MNTKRFIALSGSLAALLALPISGAAKASEFLAAQSYGGNSTAELTVTVTGLETEDGQIMVGLYNTENGFKTEQEFMGQTQSVSGDSVSLTFDDLPVGRYAIKVFHDKDSDNSLDTNVLGIPSEPYGFSNNASDPFSAPEWSETEFMLPRGRMTQTINLS
jgi:uncharacterized protein (DUF2141 family)